jgi:hypothetical protein
VIASSRLTVCRSVIDLASFLGRLTLDGRYDGRNNEHSECYTDEEPCPIDFESHDQSTYLPALIPALTEPLNLMCNSMAMSRAAPTVAASCVDVSQRNGDILPCALEST